VSVACTGFAVTDRNPLVSRGIQCRVRTLDYTPDHGKIHGEMLCHINGKGDANMTTDQRIAALVLVCAVMTGFVCAPAYAAEREQVRAVINLMASIKMPYPERFERNVARTEHVQLDARGATVACLRLDDKVRWCYEHIPTQGARAEMLRIRNEPVGGIQVGHVYHFVVDYDLDGLADVGSTTRMDPPAHAPVAAIAQFFHRGTARGDQLRGEYQKLFDDGIQVALKHLGE